MGFLSTTVDLVCISLNEQLFKNHRIIYMRIVLVDFDVFNQLEEKK